MHARMKAPQAPPLRLPKDGRLESTKALRSDPYGYIAGTCRTLGSDAFEARILLQRTILMSGPDAAAVFYDGSRFVRARAAPRFLRKTLFGEGGVQMLDGDAHDARKRLFMTVLTPQSVESLVDHVQAAWEQSVADWSRRSEIVLYDALLPLLARAVCDWSGVPVSERELPRRARMLRSLFDGAGAMGFAHWRSRRARSEAESWIGRFVDHTRVLCVSAAPRHAAVAIACYTDANGRMLDRRTAAVEILNVLRPTVAVSVFIVDAALALHRHPEMRERAAHDARFRRAFVQEVRRFYPFFPSVAARVRRDFVWHGYRFTAGRRAMLDLFGTDHDARAWADPDTFDPGRFLRDAPGPWAFVPQGGGDAGVTHRCPGEPAAVAIMDLAVQTLLTRMRYELPEQDLALDWRRLPALPRSGLLLRGVRRA